MQHTGYYVAVNNSTPGTTSQEVQDMKAIPHRQISLLGGAFTLNAWMQNHLAAVDITGATANNAEKAA